MAGDRLPRVAGSLLVASSGPSTRLAANSSKGFTLDNYKELLDQSVYKDVAVRTIGIASAATVTDVLLAFPIAFYIGEGRHPRGSRASSWSRS